jgi:transposase InsO family protein
MAAGFRYEIGVAAYTMAIRALKACGMKTLGIYSGIRHGRGATATVRLLRDEGVQGGSRHLMRILSMRLQPGSFGRIWFTIGNKGQGSRICGV